MILLVPNGSKVMDGCMLKEHRKRLRELSA